MCTHTDTHTHQSLTKNLLPVRPTKGSTALASRCLRSPPFDELTWVNWSKKFCGGCWDFATEDEEGEGEGTGEGEVGEEEGVLALLQSSPLQSGEKKDKNRT